MRHTSAQHGWAAIKSLANQACCLKNPHNINECCSQQAARGPTGCVPFTPKMPRNGRLPADTRTDTHKRQVTTLSGPFSFTAEQPHSTNSPHLQLLLIRTSVPSQWSCMSPLINRMHPHILKEHANARPAWHELFKRFARPHLPSVMPS
jgi:hypothetical protein